MTEPTTPIPGPPPPGPLPGAPFAPEPPDHPQALVVLILGILGVSMVPLTAPVAWYLGNQALKEIDAQPGRYSRRDWVKVGRILGIVGTALLAFVVLMFLAFFLVWLVSVAAMV